MQHLDRFYSTSLYILCACVSWNIFALISTRSPALALSDALSHSLPKTNPAQSIDSGSLSSHLSAQHTNPPPRPTTEIDPLPPTPDSPPLTTPTPTAPDSPLPDSPSPSPPAQTVQINQIQVIGSTVFSPDDFAPLLQPYTGRSLTLAELQQAADEITQLYLDRGYLTSRAVLVDQAIENGVVQIRVIEGALERIEIEGNRRVDPAYIRSRIALGGRTPIRQADLEDQLRLLRLDPLFDNVEASLRPGSGIGQSILMVRITEADPWFGTVGVDNYSPPSVGSERLGVSVGYRNLTGLGDELYGSYYRSTTGGSDLLDFSYRVPINPLNGTIQLRAAPNFYTITDPAFDELDIHGQQSLYEITYRQPLIQSPREEFALSIGLTYEDGETLIGSFLSDSSTTSVIQFAQDYIRRDTRGAWAARSQFNFGTGLFDATHDNHSTPDGQFFSWLGQFQRVQIFNTRNLLITQLDVQLTPDGLLSSQQFVIGGGQSVRGYQQNIRLGDNGVRFSIEDRITLLQNESGQPTLQLAPFVDLGTVWNAANNPNSLPDQRFLAGVGVGLLWEIFPDLNLRLDAALPLVELPDSGDNAQDEGFYFSVGYQF